MPLWSDTDGIADVHACAPVSVPPRCSWPPAPFSCPNHRLQEMILDTCIELIGGLVHLHDRNIIHGDLVRGRMVDGAMPLGASSLATACPIETQYITSRAVSRHDLQYLKEPCCSDTAAASRWRSLAPSLGLLSDASVRCPCSRQSLIVFSRLCAAPCHPLRDLQNPNNVLLKRDMNKKYGATCKIADFGLSIKMSADQSHISNMRRGTVRAREGRMGGVTCCSA